MAASGGGKPSGPLDKYFAPLKKRAYEQILKDHDGKTPDEMPATISISVRKDVASRPKEAKLTIVEDGVSDAPGKQMDATGRISILNPLKIPPSHVFKNAANESAKECVASASDESGNGKISPMVNF